jgi:peptidoglycan/LPS O-acetylase OafA/YrhL
MHVRAPRHYPCLDGLRALAILLIVPHNADIVTPVTQGPFKIFTLLIDRGWIGVQLFLRFVGLSDYRAALRITPCFELF